MNILLINPTFHSRFALGLSYSEPLGLAYIAASIERLKRHEVEIIDSVGAAEAFEKKDGVLRVGLAEDDLLSRIAAKKPDLIGVSVVSTLHAREILAFLGGIKSMHPRVPIIIGGAHATLEWERCMAVPAVDFIVLGEGEETIVDLLNAIEGKSADFSAIPGIVFRNPAGVPVKTAAREPLDIDSLPYPARHLLPMNNYFRRQPRYYYMRRPVATIITSRACPYKCVFCSTTLLWGRRFRGRSPQSVVDEMKHCIAAYGVAEFLINDDCFLGDKKRALDLCDLIVGAGLDIRFQIPPGVNLHHLDEKLLRALKAAGLYVIQPEFESGNPRTIDYIRKPIDLDKGKAVIRTANRLGLWTKTNIIIGFPRETREDIELSIRFAERLEVDAINFLLPIPYRHTDLGRDYMKLGLMESAPDGEAYACDSLHFPKERLERFRRGAMRRFAVRRILRFFNPRYVLFNFFPKIGTPERLGLFCRRLFFGTFRFLFNDLA